MAAVRGEHTPAVAKLLKAGAAPLLENYADTTALDIAQVPPQPTKHCRNSHFGAWARCQECNLAVPSLLCAADCHLSRLAQLAGNEEQGDLQAAVHSHHPPRVGERAAGHAAPHGGPGVRRGRGRGADREGARCCHNVH